jgi:D-3-phosphoglycerate dehydrogenase
MSETAAPIKPCRVVLFERWAHPIAEELLPAYPELQPQIMSITGSEAAAWKMLERANVYQARSTRSELPKAFWVDEPLLSRCPDLLAVSTNGSGYDTLNLDACTNAGVLAVHQAGGNKQGVAEHAIGMMLCLSKRIVEADRAMRSQSDLQRERYMGHDAHGTTLGVIGLGHIGTHVARLASGLLGMRVLAYDPFVDPALFAERGAERVALNELLGEADFVSVHCPRTESSEFMMDAEAFARMKPTAYFINTARGGIHDEVALAEALENGKLAGAGLDVWENEPPDLAHPLLAMDNVIASPHTAGVTHESRANVVRITIEQIASVARGERPPRLLNPEVWPVYIERMQRILG